MAFIRLNYTTDRKDDSNTLHDKARGLFLSGANNGGFAGPCLLSLDKRIKDEFDMDKFRRLIQ